MIEVGSSQALQELTELVHAGQLLTLTQDGKPLALVVPIGNQPTKPSIVGALKDVLTEEIVVPKWVVEDDQISTSKPE
jgi:antitoxin (DNA-binding transcriptional repressor) of toxin-antitoxin stability system